jgi:16S rRNA (adenine1518-N6/adenine1519-N6)-dimethyltransferase
MNMASIYKELKEYGLLPKKRLGQHFLVDQNILTKIVLTAQIGKEDVVLEVGPGLGEMTHILARHSKKVIAVEIDAKLVAVLREKFSNIANVEIVRGDILKIDFEKFFEQEKGPIKVVANLPYQISTPLLFRFIESRNIFSTLTLMLQREVAERMAASPGGKEYGPLSVFVQSFSDLSIRFFVKPSAFVPPPRVESAVVHIYWKGEPAVSKEDEEWFRRVVKGSLGYRRKTLLNALKHSGLLLPGVEQIIEKIGMDPRRRPETLSINEFVSLAKALRP